MAAESTTEDAAAADAPPPEPNAEDKSDAPTPPSKEGSKKEDADRALLDAVNVALSFKELGNARFKAGDNAGAVAEYDKGLETLKNARDRAVELLRAATSGVPRRASREDERRSPTRGARREGAR